MYCGRCPHPCSPPAVWRLRLAEDHHHVLCRLEQIQNVFKEEEPATAQDISEGTIESAILVHELAYVLGQMQNDVALPALIERLSESKEHIMVRHEAAEALGAIGNLSARPILEEFLNDENPEVAESCEVALDLLRWCSSEEWDNAEW